MNDGDIQQTGSSREKRHMILANETDIIRRCQRGDQEAFAELYRHYERPMLSLAYRMLHSQEEAEDALPDAFLGMYRGIGRFRAEAAFSTWLYRIVANTCYRRLKRRKHGTHVDLDTVGEIPTRGGDARMRHMLDRAIASLPPRMKACFVLFAQEGFMQHEIAEMLDIELGTVKSQVFEARAKLREQLAPRLRGFRADEVR